MHRLLGTSLALTLAMGLAFTADCGGSSSSPIETPGKCIPGASPSCTGPGGCSGYQVCNAQGTALGACSCGNGGGDSGALDDGASSSGQGASSGSSSGSGSGGDVDAGDASDSSGSSSGASSSGSSSSSSSSSSSGSGSSSSSGSGGCVAASCPACTLLSTACCKSNGAGCGCSSVPFGCQ